MRIRKLDIKDAPLMLEWMHDDDVVRYLKADFKNKSIDDCERFIKFANDSDENKHYAIVDETDEYVGTVSLKHISADSAEFGITIRKHAMGKGYAGFAMAQIIEIAKELGLKKIYWCVKPSNLRAIRFYTKHGYSMIQVPYEVKGYSEQEKSEFTWFGTDLQGIVH